MTKINLRGYHQEIEKMINSGQTEEAIAHCKYILKFFPKDVDTYRLLGKAYLERQKYTEAADILQRVLSVVPDDFISQIGMSIIREDEGNLDAAIWHMERAFECQPANNALQDEIRRLYSRRDGLEPPKIRLTRGALARTYVQGALYPQAVAELRAALTNDPHRTDLELLLARTYYNAGQSVEAASICGRILSKLPYCMEANQILSSILPSATKADEIRNCQRRLQSLNPYAIYISSNAPTASEVPDNAITIERLEWQPAEIGGQQPEWAKTVGIDLGEETQGIPAWLSPPAEATEAGSELASETGENQEIYAETAQPATESSLPEWMRAAGWTEAREEVKEISGEPIIEMDQVVEAEIPEWLRGMAPQKTESVISPEETQKISALDQILPPADSIQPAMISDQTPDISLELEKPLQLVSTDQEETPIETTGLPDWLGSIDTLEEKAELPIEAGIPIATTDLPVAVPTPGIPVTSAPEDDTFAWLESLAVQEGVDQATLLTTEVDKEKLEINLPEPPPSEEIPIQPQGEVAPVSEAAQAGEMDATFAWLESLAAQEGVDQETLLTRPEEREIAYAHPAIELPAEESLKEPVTGTITETISETPDVIQPVSEEQTAELEAPTDNLPEWLSRLEQIETPQALHPAEIQFTPDLIPEMVTPAVSELEAAEIPSEPIQPASEGAPSEPLEVRSSISALEMSTPEISLEVAEISEETVEKPLPVEVLPKPEPGLVKVEATSYSQAQSDLYEGKFESALSVYNQMIQAGGNLDEIIHDLRDALYRYPINIEIWQSLGDAYSASNRLSEAMDAYTKAEELLR